MGTECLTLNVIRSQDRPSCTGHRLSYSGKTFCCPVLSLHPDAGTPLTEDIAECHTPSGSGEMVAVVTLRTLGRPNHKLQPAGLPLRVVDGTRVVKLNYKKPRFEGCPFGHALKSPVRVEIQSTWEGLSKLNKNLPIFCF